ncbi:MAG: aldo/keto reductase [Candidatus Omnitrophica bacterium]|nr:aldo/keto reductase [Candidatus Omnitrophota bacterium]
MKYRKLGKTDLKISSVVLGSWVFGGECWGEVRDEESISVLKDAINRGVNCIDTAPIYGNGRSEEVIGKALKDVSEDVIIATKCGLEKHGKAIRPNLSAKFIREEIENSLRRLNVEKIDLYQCHWPDPNTSRKETFTELSKLTEEGKVRYIGVSNFDKDFLEKAIQIAPVQSNQMPYSIFDRDIEKEMVPFCENNGVSILSYGSLGGGILTGKYKEPPDFSKGDVRSFFYKYYREPFWSKSRKIVNVLENIADRRQVPVSNVAINWVLSRKEVAGCITGCRTLEQLKGNVTAVDWDITEEELLMIEDAYVKIWGSFLS